MTTVLILGSGPNATLARCWARAPFDHILAINNAWQVRPDWDALILLLGYLILQLLGVDIYTPER